MRFKTQKHLFKTYGGLLSVWVGFISEMARTATMRLYITILIAAISSSIIAGDTDLAKAKIAQFVIISIAATTIGTVGNVIFVRGLNSAYERSMLTYFKKLTKKDMAFYRDNQTGYLTAIFRQHLDGQNELMKFYQSSAIQTSFSVILPVIILTYYSRPIGGMALLLIVAQMLYMIFASKHSNDLRKRSHELYRRISGEVSDVITNIIAYKSRGESKGQYRHMEALAKEETAIFQKRRTMQLLLDLPRSIITTLLAACIFWVMANTVDTAGGNYDVLIITLFYTFQIMRNVSVLPTLIQQHDSMTTKYEPTLEILKDKNETIIDTPNSKSIESFRGKIEIKNLDFRYPGSGGYVLKILI